MPILRLDQQRKRIKVAEFEIENPIVFEFFDSRSEADRDELLKRAIHIGMLALAEDLLEFYQGMRCGNNSKPSRRKSKHSQSRNRKQSEDEMNKNQDPDPPSPDAIESRLIELGTLLPQAASGALRHREQSSNPEWRGADVQVTSDFEWEPSGFFDAHDLLVRTRHAEAVTWLILEIHDAFSGWIDYANKCEFYGALAQAALKHLAKHQPEPDDAVPLLKAVLKRAFRWQQTLRKDGKIADQAIVVIHERDAEGHQRRTDAASGEECD
jgi:hypothetical protein